MLPIDNIYIYIKGPSIRRRVRTLLISWGKKTRVKHCHADLSSWYEFWFAIICVDMNVISDLFQGTATQQFLETVSIPTTMRILFIEIQWQGIILAPMCLCQGKMWKSKVKNVFSYHFPRWPVGVRPCYAVPKFPRLRDHLRLINHKNTATSSIRCCDQVFLQIMAFYVQKIWTGMVSNNKISWSATYEILTYFHRELRFVS